MRKLALLIAVTSTFFAFAMIPANAEGGCYRMGLSGYHWYGFCVGPNFLYPHERVCRHGHCWYR
jgi:hypothetical protein